MKQIRTGAALAIGLVVGVALLADLLRPLLPWLIALFFLACLLKLASRD